MKKKQISMLLSAALLMFCACSKNDNSSPENGGGTDSSSTKPKDGAFVISASGGLGRADIMYTSNTLDSGELNIQGTGVEQSGSRNYIVSDSLIFSLMFGGSGAGAVSAYKLSNDKKLEKVSEFQSETMHVKGKVGSDILLMKQAWQPAEEYTKWFQINTKTLQIQSQGELNVKVMDGEDKKEKVFFTSFNKVGDKVFAPYWSITSGQTFSSAYLDSNWIAVFDYPSMALNKTIRDGRTGSIGAYFASGLEIDEKNDIYVFGTKLQYRTASPPENASKTPVGIMKIKSGTTEYDPTFFINITQAAGEGVYIYRKMYLGKGYYLLTTGKDRVLYNPYGTTLNVIYKSTIRYAVVNVYDGTFKWVTGAPDPSTIVNTSADYSDNYTTLDGTGYLAITSGTSFTSANSTVYKFDAVKATATPGLTVKNAYITALNWIPVSK